MSEYLRPGGFPFRVETIPGEEVAKWEAAQRAMEAIKRDYEHVKTNSLDEFAGCRVSGRWSDEAPDECFHNVAWEALQ